MAADEDDDGGVLEALDELNEYIGTAIVRAREERRPTIEAVARVVGETFERLTASGEVDVAPILTGPDTWSWGDREMIAQGFDRIYVLTGSTLPGAEGYPLMTIRQVIAPHFDSNLSVSTLVFGPDDDDIARSVALLITHHAAAFQGLREAVTISARAGGMAALENVRQTKREVDALAGGPVPSSAKKEDLN